MDQVTLLWTLAATLLGGLQLFFQKVVAEEKRNSAFNGFMMYGISAVAAFSILLLQRELPAGWLMASLFGLVGGIFHASGNFIRIEALKYIDSVIYFPLNKMLGPLLVVIGGVFLFGESLKAIQYVGIALSLSVPLILITSAEHHRQNNLRQGLIFVVVSTVLTAISALLMKQGTVFDPSVLLLLVYAQVAGAVSSAIIFFRQTGSSRLRVASLEKRDLQLGIIAGAIALFSAYTMLKALSLGLASLVYVIHAHYILIPIVLSVWWYGDHINVRKFAAVVVSFLAIALLAI